MKTQLIYQCPTCSVPRDFELEHIDSVMSNGSIRCETCDSDILITEKSYQDVKTRRKQFSNVVKAQRVAISIVFISLLLLLFGYIPLSVMLCGFAVSGIVYFKADSTLLTKRELEFKPMI